MRKKNAVMLQSKVLPVKKIFNVSQNIIKNVPLKVFRNIYSRLVMSDLTHQAVTNRWSLVVHSFCPSVHITEKCYMGRVIKFN